MPTPDIYIPLKEQLSQPLPGLDAQLKMATLKRMDKLSDYTVPDNAKEAAVMILLYPDAGKLHLPLIVRNVYPGVHSGQVALPGGTKDPEDGSFLATALRETEEEIGVPQNHIEVLGELSKLYIPPSNFLVQPFVGRVAGKPAFIPDTSEVAHLIESPLEAFLDGNNIGEGTVTVRGSMRLQVPRYLIQGHTVWGATAMMMAEFTEIVKKIV